MKLIVTIELDHSIEYFRSNGDDCATILREYARYIYAVGLKASYHPRILYSDNGTRVGTAEVQP